MNLANKLPIPLLLCALAACGTNEDSGNQGSDEDVDPVKFEPMDGQLEAMDALCDWGATVEANRTATDARELLNPSDECLDAIEATITWSNTFAANGDLGAIAKASALESVWALFYLPPEVPVTGFLLDETVVVPEGTSAYFPLDSSAGPDQVGVNVPWVNTAIRERFYDSVWLLAYKPGALALGVQAKWKNNVVTVGQAFHQRSLDANGRPNWKLGDQFELAAVLFHETLHGVDSPWNHELCPTQNADDEPSCDNDIETSAYAYELALLEGQQIALLRVADDSGLPLVNASDWNGALEAACERAKHITDALWPGYLPQRDCDGFGTNLRDDYEKEYLP